MALVIADRVKESSTTTGTGAMDLDGAVNSFQRFLEATDISTGDTVPYVIDHQDDDQWETGRGTVNSGSPDTLSRDTVFQSSNNDSAVDFNSGTKHVFVGVLADDVNSGVLLDDGSITETELATSVSGTGLSGGGGSALSVDEANVDHDALLNFVANEHIDHSGVTLTAGTGLSGGGDLTASRSLSVDNYADLARLDLAETVTGAWTFNDDVTLGMGNQDVVVQDVGRNLDFAAQGTGGDNFILSVRDGDNDGTNFVALRLNIIGDVIDTDYELADFVYNPNGPRIEVRDRTGGTGSPIPVHVFSAGNTDQIIARTDGNVAMSGSLKVGGTGAAAEALEVEGTALATELTFDDIGFRSRVEAIAMTIAEDLEGELDAVTAGWGDGRRLGVNTDAYSPSNDTTTRTFDANSTTVDEIADVLATLIRDLGRDS